jgi:hypothetical protein
MSILESIRLQELQRQRQPPSLEHKTLLYFYYVTSVRQRFDYAGCCKLGAELDEASSTGHADMRA